MKFFAIITTALVVASVSAGTLRSEYKYREHAEAMAKATKERVEGWEANNRAVQEATEKRVEGWQKNREEINKATAEKFDRLAEERSKEQDKKQEARRQRDQAREDMHTQRNIDAYDTIPEKLQQLQYWESRSMEFALRSAQHAQYKCICKKFKRKSLFKIDCIEPKPKPCKDLYGRAILVREAEQPYHALQKAYKDLSSQMDGQDESKNKEIYEKACEEDLAALGRLGFMCKNYKKY